MSENQLNKIQIKAEILMVLSKLQSLPELSEIESVLEVLEEQENKKAIQDVLIKELLKSNEQKAALICFMLIRLCEQESLEQALWEILQNPAINDFVKAIILNLLKDLGNKVEYDKLETYFENPDEVIDADTKKLLNVAIVNPEAQIDFLDFLSSISDEDKHILINSLSDDYSSNELANILVPLFLYEPTTEIGHATAGILGETKSQLAFHALNDALKFINEDSTRSVINKSLSTLKLSGIREDNAQEFYKDILKETKPYECYSSYPDGHGNLALIYSRIREDDTIQLVASVVNDSWGIIDCFGFNEISKAEFERIIDRFYSGDERVKIAPQVIKSVLQRAEALTRKTDGHISYEYICWKTLFADIQEEPVPVEFILNQKFEKVKLKEKDLEKIYTLDFTQRGFVDVDYNSEFKILIEELNEKIKKDDFKIDFDNVVKNNTPLIFTNEEKNKLDKRILMSAYLKYLSNDKKDAQLLFSLYYDEPLKHELTENIVRKSIYEYYVALKFKQKESKQTTNIFTLKNKPKVQELTMKQLELMISIIESLWVKNA